MSIPRIHCHSAFKHYEMFHNNCGSSYGNSIFNTTYNFNGGNICGGGFWGGLFGGLGMGLGAGLMNWLGGGMNMFGGMMGGFPMMNMFGGGFPMMNMWGMGGGSKIVDGAGGKDKTKNKGNDNKKCDDHDRTKLADLNKKEEKLETDLKAKKDGSIKELKALYIEAVEAQKASKDDDAHNGTDSTEYATLIARLKKLAIENNLEEKDGELIDKTPAQTRAEETPVEEAQAQTQAEEAPAGQASAPAVQAPPATSNLTDKASGDLSPEDIKKLTDAQAKEILGNDKNKRLNDDGTVKVPRTYNELLLAWKSGLRIQFCKNTDSENDSNKSATISGKIISEVENGGNEGDNLYNVWVQDKHGKYKLQFNLNEGNKTIQVIDTEELDDSDENDYKLDLDNYHRGEEQYRYNINDDDDWATRQGEPLIHRK